LIEQRVDYHEYLASREWRLKRKEVIELEGGLCARCKAAPIRSIHHLTYETLGHENIYEDLLGVCGPCHEYLAGEQADDPALPIIQDIIKRARLKPSYHLDGHFLYLDCDDPDNESEWYLTVQPTRNEDLDRRQRALVCLPFGPHITGVCVWQ